MLDDNKPMKIEFENGSVIESLPNTEKSVRGKIRTYEVYQSKEEIQLVLDLCNKSVESNSE